MADYLGAHMSIAGGLHKAIDRAVAAGCGTLQIFTRSSNQWQGKPVSDTPIRCLLKPHPEGGYVLLTVNLDDAVMKATYEFPAGLKQVQPMFEEREPLELGEEQKSFADMYDPFEVHVYRVQ